MTRVIQHVVTPRGDRGWGSSKLAVREQLLVMFYFRNVERKACCVRSLLPIQPGMPAGSYASPGRHFCSIFLLKIRHCSHLKRTAINAENMLDRFSATPYSSAPLPPKWQAAIQCGEVSEWLKEHAWKVCIRQRIGGSNPPLTAIISDKSLYESTGFFLLYSPSRGDENPRPGFDNGQLPVGQTTNNMSGLPAQKRRERF